MLQGAEREGGQPPVSSSELVTIWGGGWVEEEGMEKSEWQLQNSPRDVESGPGNRVGAVVLTNHVNSTN